MKHDILISISVLAALVGCTKVDVRTPERVQSDVCFNTPVVSSITKVVGEIDGLYPTSESFAVFSVYHSESFNGWDTGVSYINRAEFTYNALVDDSDSDALGGWTGGYYYPKSGKLSFAAYSPFSAHADSPGVGTGTFEYASAGLSIANFTIPELAAQYDLLYSERIYDKTANDGVGDGYEGLDLVFQHALSSIKFKVQKKAAYTGYTITLKSISLENINYKGSFAENIQNETSDVYASKPAWTPTNEFDESDGLDDLTNYMIYNSSLVITEAATDTDDVKFHTIPQGAILLPQTFGESDTALIRVNYTIKPTSMPEISQTATIPLNKLSEGWVIGKRYTYNISIGYDTITISPTVIGWEDVNGDVAVN
ncbi:MAG: fimbrillin family protein [Bacteroidales bacterium]|nr:fimbrillin family protein [Bacteroidales bacterium]